MMTQLTKCELGLVKEIRQQLHRVPEPSGSEEKTKALIRAFITAHTGLSCFDYGGGTCGLYTPPEEALEEAICLRADFDAVSLPEGDAAHLCGHDGHTAALLGVALFLERTRPGRRVLLMFQPSEETGEGAEAMAPLLKEYKITRIYGCHNLPGFPFGRVFTSLDTFACASSGMTFAFTGKPAHAAYPEYGVSPAGAVAEFLAEVQAFNREVPFGGGTFATVVGCNMGQKAFGTAAERAEVWITMRSDTNDNFMKLKAFLNSRSEAYAQQNGLTLSVMEQDAFPATENDETAARELLDRTGGELLTEPMRWSEDFGHYLNACRGAFFGIGAGACPPLHTREYEYPDELLSHQIRALIALL